MVSASPSAAAGSSLVRFRRRVTTEAEALERAMEDFQDPSQESRQR
jgi:hypothetical protein